MPKKIKQEKELKFKNNDENLINANNINAILMCILGVCVIVLVIVGVTKFSIDKYHAHRGNAIVNFEYTRKAETGYDSYIVTYYPSDNSAYAAKNTMEESIDTKWGNNKYLNFNEEVYRSGILDSESSISTEGADPDWFITVRTKDGTKYYYSSDATNQVDVEVMNKIINKYYK